MNSSRREAVLLLAIHVLAGLILLSPGYIRPDSVGVMAWLRSAVFDGDLLFFNEWEGFGMVQGNTVAFKEVTPVHTLANHWWIGTSVLAAPPYLVAHVVCRSVPSLGGAGFFGLYGAVLGWLSVLLGFLVSRACLSLFREAGVTVRARWAAIAAVWVGTPLLWYTFRYPIGTHASGAACVGVLCLLILSERQNLLPPGWYGLACGAALGLAAACRIQHLVLLGGVLFVARVRRWSPRVGAGVAAGLVAGLLPQACAWWVVYGSPLGPLNSGAAEGGGTWEMGRLQIVLDVLLSSWHGLEIWAPVVVLAIIGWMLRLRSDRVAPMALILFFTGELIANSLGDRYYWGGMSFGPRRFVDLSVPFILGVAWFLDGGRRWITFTLTGAAAAWTALLALAATSGTLDLSLDPGYAGLVASVFRSEVLSGLSFGVLHSPVTSAGLLMQSVVACAILGLALLLGCWLIRRPKRAVAAALVLPLAAAGLLLATAPRTSQRADAELARLGISSARFELGPLLDKRKLLGHELEHERQRGRTHRADALVHELAQLDDRINQIEAAAP